MSTRFAWLRSADPFDVLLIVVFAIVTGIFLAPYLALPFAIGGDARVYADAAHRWLTGLDPWGPRPGSAITFGAPPHALLFFAPFAFLPPIVTAILWVFGLLVASIVAIRRLGLPMWWLAFPPLSTAIIVGSLDALAFVLLVLGPAWLAPLAKPYAILPLIAERRVTAILISVAVSLVTLLVLPWQTFLADLPTISGNLGRHSRDLSAFGEPVGMVVGAAALLALGLRRGLWLATPVLWPSSQIHYAAMTIPALTRVSALFFALPIPGAPLVGVVAAAVIRWVRPRLDPPVLDLDAHPIATR